MGKATLAWRIARFLLALPPEEEGGLFGDTPPAHTSLHVDPEHPISHRIRALSEPGVFLLRRGWAGSTESAREKVTARRQILLQKSGSTKCVSSAAFLHMSMADGGRRIVIVDSADELNVNAANALLKMLEEPPARTVMLLISHQPSRLLPTIRSRCRELRLNPLQPDDMPQKRLKQAGFEAAETPALAELAGGSVGEALRLIQQDGLALYAELLALFSTRQGFDRPRALNMANAMTGRGAGERFEMLLTLLDLFLLRTGPHRCPRSTTLR